MCNLVIRKFAIFSSGLIFKEKLIFTMALQVSTEQCILITLEYTKKKERKEKSKEVYFYAINTEVHSNLQFYIVRRSKCTH